MKDNRRAVRLRVARNVQKLRLSQELTQEELAEKAGSTTKHVGLVERGEVNVTIDKLAAIAAALSVDVGELFDPKVRNVYPLTSAQIARLERALRIVERMKQAGRKRTRSRCD